MPIYATAVDVAAYLAAGGTTATLPAGATGDALIDRAELDVDELLGGWPILATGRKMDVARLTAGEATALSRSVAAQVEHLLVTGEEIVRAGRDDSPVLSAVEGPDFKKQYAVSVVKAKIRRYSPNLKRELAPIRHLRILEGRAVA